MGGEGVHICLPWWYNSVALGLAARDGLGWNAPDEVSFTLLL